MKDAASKYNIPVWDIWQLRNGWEEDTISDGGEHLEAGWDACNHQNGEQYHVDFQVMYFLGNPKNLLGFPRKSWQFPRIS